MMMTINQWKLSGCPFVEGVKIYREKCGNTRLLAIFEQHQKNGYIPDYFKNQLYQELQNLENAGQLIDVPPPPPKKEDQPPSPPPPPSSPLTKKAQQPTTDEPAEIQDLREHIRRNYKQYSYLHAQLSKETNQHRRYQIAKTIVNYILPEIDSMYNEISEWKRSGQLPLVWDMRVVKEVLRMYTRRRTIVNQVNSLTRKNEQEKRPSIIAEIEVEIEEKTKEIEYLSAKLGIKWKSKSQ